MDGHKDDVLPVLDDGHPPAEVTLRVCAAPSYTPIGVYWMPGFSPGLPGSSTTGSEGSADTLGCEIYVPPGSVLQLTANGFKASELYR